MKRKAALRFWMSVRRHLSAFSSVSTHISFVVDFMLAALMMRLLVSLTDSQRKENFSAHAGCFTVIHAQNFKVVQSAINQQLKLFFMSRNWFEMSSSSVLVVFLDNMTLRCFCC